MGGGGVFLITGGGGDDARVLKETALVWWNF